MRALGTDIGLFCALSLSLFWKPVLTLRVTDICAAGTLHPLWQAGEGVEVSVSTPNCPLLRDHLVGDGTSIQQGIEDLTGRVPAAL